MPWTYVGLVLLQVVGVGCLVAAVHWRREGSGRGWSSWPTQDVNRILLTLPGAGLCALSAGVMMWPGLPRGVSAVLIFPFLAGVAMLALDVFWRAPLWWVPRWAREAVAHRREVEKRNAKNRKRRSRR